MSFGSAPVIGLDIGTSAVRAAQIGTGRSGRSLAAFGQVPLPAGAVADGEIRDPAAVADAVSQLWKRAKLKSKRAVIGVANQRVVVRQVDLPFLDEKEFRSSLRFQVADHIPMSADDAELDFQLIEDYMTENGEHMMRILLVAAARDMVESFVSVATSAGLSPVGVDLTPFAVARAVSSSARGEMGVGGAEAVVDVGAGVTNIVVHHNGEARFVRILLVGGDDATNALAKELDVPFEEAEAIKFDLGRGVGSPEATSVLRERVTSLVEEVRGSIDYYLSQDESEGITSIIVTGGGSLTPGLAEELENVSGLQVQRGTSLADMNIARSGLTQEQAVQVEPVAAAAVGLAIGASAK
nr:type IV pilus assembly protein PilM [Actinomycetota bacterium]